MADEKPKEDSAPQRSWDPYFNGGMAFDKKHATPLECPHRAGLPCSYCGKKSNGPDDTPAT